MYLSNFSLPDASARGWLIALTALGVEWDLHNYATFDGFDYLTTAEQSMLTLNWHITGQAIAWVKTQGVPNAEEIPNYPGHRFCLVFTNVDYLEITPRDPEMPKEEDLGISWMSFIEVGEDLTEYIHANLIPGYVPRDQTLPYHMAFCFNGGQIIRVGAAQAEFVLRE